MQKQKTLEQPVEISGIGLHSGRFIEVTLMPAPAGHGIMFERTDIKDRKATIPAHIDYAVSRRLCTRIENEDGVGVNTIEHFMAAFHGLGIDNLHIEIDGAEMPILDGSSAHIAEMIMQAGLTEQDAEKQMLVITQNIELVTEQGIAMTLSPCDGLELDVDIDFPDRAIGKQHMHYTHSEDGFSEELSSARTFCMMRDVEAMRSSGLGQGGSLDNAVVVENGRVLNSDGLRFPDEFVRHKVLDCLGDLFLLGMGLKARISVSRPGHAASTELLKQLKLRPDVFQIIGKPAQPAPSFALPETAVAAQA